MYIDCPQTTDSRFLKKFRRRFRHPYAQFNWFANEAIKENWFPKWKPNGTDAAGKKSSPLKLLILGAFRYLGRGLTFDDMEECTAISEEVHRVFFHPDESFANTLNPTVGTVRSFTSNLFPLGEAKLVLPTNPGFGWLKPITSVTHRSSRSLQFKISLFYITISQFLTTHRISRSLSSIIWTMQLDNKMTDYESVGPAYGGEYMTT